jgi:hypothetical protein
MRSLLHQQLIGSRKCQFVERATRRMEMRENTIYSASIRQHQGDAFNPFPYWIADAADLPVGSLL